MKARRSHSKRCESRAALHKSHPGDGDSLLARSVRDFARASELVVAAIPLIALCGTAGFRHPTRSSALGGIFTLHLCTSV